MWRSVILLAFFGLLRVSEFTCGSQIFDNTIHLSREDVYFNQAYSIMYTRLKASKTDPFRSSVIVRLAAINLCPVQAMRRYLEFRRLAPGLLFILDNGSFLNRRFLVALLEMALLGVPNINTPTASVLVVLKPRYLQALQMH